YEAGAFSVHYYEHRFPLAPGTYERVLGRRLEELEKTLGKDAEAFIEYQSILTAVGHLPPRNTTDPQKVAERQREKEVIKRRLATLTDNSPEVLAFLEQNL